MATALQMLARQVLERAFNELLRIALDNVNQIDQRVAALSEQQQELSLVSGANVAVVDSARGACTFELRDKRNRSACWRRKWVEEQCRAVE